MILSPGERDPSQRDYNVSRLKVYALHVSMKHAKIDGQK